MWLRSGTTTAAAIAVAIAIPLLAWWVNGFVTPGMVAVGAVGGLCTWFWRLLIP